MHLQFHLAALVLFAALIHAIWNAVVKSSGDRFLTFTVIHFVGTVLGTLAAFFVPLPDATMWPYLLASAVIHNIYFVFLLLCYRWGDLSQVYPIARGSSPVFIALLAAVFADEVPSPGAMAAIALVSFGIVALAFSRGKETHLEIRPVVLALVTGGLISAYTVVDGLGLRSGGSVWSYIVWLNVLEGIPFVVWAATVRRVDMGPFLKTRGKLAAASGLLTMLAYGLVLYALSQGAMAHVSALRETSVLFAAAIGTVLLKEHFGPRRIAAAVLIVAGVILLRVLP